jgi:hypothetical protein
MSVATLSDSRTIDRTLAFTREMVLEEIWDTVFGYSPLLAVGFGKLQNAKFGPVPMNGRAVMTHNGGESIRIRHNLGSNTTAQTMVGPWGTVDTTPSDTVRPSSLNYRHYNSTITVSTTDELMNRGEEALSSLVAFETENSVRSLADLVGTHLYASTNATQVADLDDHIGTGTHQGLSSTTYPTWFSRGLSARGTAVASVSFTSGSFAVQGLDDMIVCWNNASEGAVQPHGIFTTYSVFGFYEASLQPQQRFQNTDMANGGFTQLAFHSAPVFPDSKCNSGSLYMLNFDVFKIHCLAGAEFDATPFIDAQDQEAKTSKILLKCNTGVADRRFVNAMRSITA